MGGGGVKTKLGCHEPSPRTGTTKFANNPVVRENLFLHIDPVQTNAGNITEHLYSWKMPATNFLIHPAPLLIPGIAASSAATHLAEARSDPYYLPRKCGVVVGWGSGQ